MAGCSLFLSHLTVESKLAELISRHIKEDFIGLAKVFVSSDRTSIPVGSKWLEKLIQEIQESNMHLVLCSPESITRPWIHYEAGAARLCGLPSVPLCHSGLSHVQLPVPLSEGQGIQLDAAGIQALYTSIASLLNSSVPQVDFDSYAKEVDALEEEYVRDRETAKSFSVTARDEAITITDPRVVCVSSKQFIQLGFENQIDMVLEAFPQRIAHSRVATSQELVQLLTTEKVQVVHIAAFVCPRTGDLYFSEVDIATGRSTTSENDVLEADSLAVLLKMAETRLVVIGSCESLVLAASLLSITNVVATRDMVSPKMMAKWVETFYNTLNHQPLFSAFQLAVNVSGAPMKLYARTDMKMKAQP